MANSEWRGGKGGSALGPIFYSLFATRHLSLFLDDLGLNLDRRLRLFHHRFGVVDGVVDVVDQLGDARGVAAEIAFEIARRGADIDSRTLAVGRDADRHILAESHDRRPRYRLDTAA